MDFLLEIVELFLPFQAVKLLLILRETGFSEYELDILEDIQCALEPIKLGITALCCQDLALHSANGFFAAFFPNLKQANLPYQHCLTVQFMPDPRNGGKM